MSTNIFIDVLLLLAVLALHGRNLSLIHPLTIYIFFHFYSFTWRAWQIAMGAPTLYSTGYGSPVEPVTYEEISRALAFADIGLVAFSIGAWAARREVDSRALRGALGGYKELVPPRIWSVIVPCMLVGSVLGYLLRSGQGDVASLGLGSYATVTSMWPITCLVMVYFITGSFWRISPFVFVYLGVVSVQGYHRFMTVLPTLALVNVSTIERRRKWPSFALVALLLSLLLVFPYLKGIGKSFGAGDYEDAVIQLKSAFVLPDKSEMAMSSDGFLDQFAGYLTLCDRYGKFEYGASYLSLVTLPIPRSLWPGKPGLGDHIIARSVDSRPYAAEGRIITYLGESYVNFGYVGIFAIPLVFGYVLCFATERAMRLPIMSFEVLLQVFLAPSMIQAYRDGMTSLILFGLVFNMPLIFVWFAHLGVPKKPAIVR